MGLVLENGIWKLQAATAASTAIWSVDFTTESSHDFTSTATATIQGVDWTIANATNARTFQITNGTGLEIVVGPNASKYWNNGLAPEITADFSDLVAGGASGAFDVEKMYVWRIIMASGSPQPNGNYEGPFCGLRTEAGLSTIGAHLHLGIFHNGSLDVTIRSARSSSNRVDVRKTSWPSGLTAPRTLTAVYCRGSFVNLLSDNAEADPLGGLPGYIGHQRFDSTNGQVLDTSTPTFDLTAAASKAYIGCNGLGGFGDTQKFVVEKAELHDIFKSLLLS
jgi:hypothetical protein